ncbi:MAG: response regulator transcription factor [Desulfobacterales bacterium]|nr:response regulator transcription factor [Desulfobacterales bacterium]
MNKKKTVLIVDDHPLFRKGLKSHIESQSEFEVVGEAGDGKEGIKMAKKLRPDLVVMDLSLPDQSGIDVTRRIRSMLSETRITILSMHSKIEYITEALQAGAHGYVVKESAAERLVECLKVISKGEYYIDSSLSHKMAKNLMGSDEKEANVKDAAYRALTPREQQILRLLAQGLTAKDIAEQLFISHRTVGNHRSNIMNKLDLHSTMELVRYATKLGIIDVDLWKG